MYDRTVGRRFNVASGAARRHLFVLVERTDMNRHFEDTRYYIKRAGEEAKRGIAEELEPLSERFEEITGGEEEPERDRLEKLQADLADLQGKAEGEAKSAIGDARERIASYRSETE
jgi:hypothetical protein